MNTRKLAQLFTLLVILALMPPSSAFAQESGMEPQLPGNPMTRMMSGLNPANWSMPKLKMPTMSTFLPSKQEKERVITKKNSLVDEVSLTAKKSWKRTKDTLNPMRLVPASFRQGSQAAPAPEAKKEGGFFSSLFAPYPEPADADVSRSVNEFLKQDPIR